MNTFKAQAFVDGDIYGILIRSDLAISLSELYQIIFHELSHIFCIVHELAGKNFFDIYCCNKENTREIGTICAGYAIWREFIADYIAVQVNPYMGHLSISDVKEEVRRLDEEVLDETSYIKTAVSEILLTIFRNQTVLRAKDHLTVMSLLKKNRVFASKLRCKYYNTLIRTIFAQLLQERCWEITPEFIYKLGIAYFCLLMGQEEMPEELSLKQQGNGVRGKKGTKNKPP